MTFLSKMLIKGIVILVIVSGGGFSNHLMAISNFAILICIGPSKVGDTLQDDFLFLQPIFTQIIRCSGFSRTYLVDEELQLDDGGSALVLTVALHAGPAEPESVASQGNNKRLTWLLACGCRPRFPHEQK